MMGDGERAKKVESQVKRPKGPRRSPGAGSSLQVVRCRESPQPHSSPETKAGGCKVWQYGLQVHMSVHPPGRPSASLRLRALAPQGKKEATLPATSVCPSPLVPEAGGGGAEGGESGHLSPGW